MPQPKKKTSKSKRDSRRAHWYKIDLPNLIKCVQCGAMILAHSACVSCGFYKGEQVMVPEVKPVKSKDKKK